MEIETSKIVRNFISDEEIILITKWANELSFIEKECNVHLDSVGKSLNGQSHMFDISNNEITNYITTFQSLSSTNTSILPDFIVSILNRISESMCLPLENMFLQVIDMKKGGRIKPHYDASYDGYINYKCNISVVSDKYDFYIGNESIEVNQSDLYCFEASLFKHWSDEFVNDRVLLSFGFLVPYIYTGRSINDPLVRLSNRIKKYFMDKL
jgi:hypothetical protein